MLLWLYGLAEVLGIAWLLLQLRQPCLPWPRWWYKGALALALAALVATFLPWSPV